MVKLFASHPLIRYTLTCIAAASMVLAFAALYPGGPIRTLPPVAQAQPRTLPGFSHIVIALEENQSYSQIIGDTADAPYINSLLTQGALFTDSHAITHPSEPNYLALFAGSTFGLTSDACPKQFSPPDLGGQLLGRSHGFAGYSESIPSAGYPGCFSPRSSNALYARKHNPWADFSDTVGPKTNLAFTRFPTDYTTLPTLSFVIPNQQDDMHSGTISAADTWLKKHLNSYVQWAKTHNSLFILTWDEDNGTTANQIATILVGANVKVNYQSSTPITHYGVLHTLEALYGLACLRRACNAPTITDVWTT